MPPVDIAELVRLARAATPGPWKNTTSYPAGEFIVHSTTAMVGDTHQRQRITPCMIEANAAYIAAAHPQAILRLCEEMREMRAVVDEQANDDGIWFIAQTGPEAYLQQELRRLHALIEGVTPDDCARSLLARAGSEK